jgi:sugar lactone lactonase YvrE
MKRAILWVAVAVLGMVAQNPVAAEALYWTDAGQIWRGNLDGSGATRLFQGFASDLALDLADRKIYFTGDLPIGGPGPSGRIWRMSFDGSRVETVLQSWSAPGGIALGGGKMYWAEGTAIRRANLDGTGEQTLVQGAAFFDSVALDLSAGKMYWTRSGADQKTAAVQRANLDGSGVEDLIALPGPATGIVLDPVGKAMYFGYVDPNIDSIYAGMIHMANLDGSGLQPIVSGLIQPGGMALDPVGEKIYWSDSAWFGGSGSLHRANLDGEAAEVIVPNLLRPRGVAVDPTPIPEPGVVMPIVLGGAGLIALRGPRHLRGQA